jgi:arylsulfatase A-like enzyme
MFTQQQLSRRSFLQTTVVSVAGLSISGCVALNKCGMSGKKPNIVFVFPDQFRAQAMGFMKQDPTITPKIDKFASESLVFENAVSNCPLCSPYRGMLMTGRWPHSTGIVTNCCSAFPDVYLRDDEVTFTDVLNKSGYDVAYLGKWHLDTPINVPKAEHWTKAIWETYVPKERRHGINFWYAYNCSDNHMNPHYWVGNAAENEKFYAKEYSPDHEAKVAAKFIENADGKQRDPKNPFAIFIAMNPPHPPFELVPEKYKILFARRKSEDLLNRPNVKRGHKPSMISVQDYFAQVYGVDQAFGRILDTIDKMGLQDDTIIVFSSDHGEMMGSHGRMGKSVPYEESLRIPFIVRWPGKIKAGRESLHINVPDYMPSLLSLMGMKDLIPQQVEGTDYSEVFLGKKIKNRPTSTFYTGGGIRTDRYTFINGTEGQKTLYDNLKDPYQLTNIADESPQEVRKLSYELLSWLEKTNDPKVETWRAILRC